MILRTVLERFFDGNQFAGASRQCEVADLLRRASDSRAETILQSEIVDVGPLSAQSLGRVEMLSLAACMRLLHERLDISYNSSRA